MLVIYVSFALFGLAWLAETVIGPTEALNPYESDCDDYGWAWY